MSDVIAVALIGGVFSIAGTIITVKSNNQKLLREMEAKLTEKMQDMKDEFVKEMNTVKVEFAASKAETDAHLEDLTQEVRKHNGFADRMPRVETEIQGIKEKIEYLHKN